MVKKMSNKARIQKKAEEAAAAEKEKKKKKKKKKETTKPKKAKKTTTRKKTASAAKRQKVVWKVFDANFREVACFPYPEKKKAYTTKDELNKKKSKNHFVNAVLVPMEEE